MDTQLTYFNFITIKWILLTKTKCQCLIFWCLDECVYWFRLLSVLDFLAWDQLATAEDVPVVAGFVYKDCLREYVHPADFILF